MARFDAQFPIQPPVMQIHFFTPEEHAAFKKQCQAYRLGRHSRAASRPSYRRRPPAPQPHPRIRYLRSRPATGRSRTLPASRCTSANRAVSNRRSHPSSNWLRGKAKPRIPRPAFPSPQFVFSTVENGAVVTETDRLRTASRGNPRVSNARRRTKQKPQNSAFQGFRNSAPPPHLRSSALNVILSTGCGRPDRNQQRQDSQDKTGP